MSVDLNVLAGEGKCVFFFFFFFFFFFLSMLPHNLTHLSTDMLQSSAVHSVKPVVCTPLKKLPFIILHPSSKHPFFFPISPISSHSLLPQVLSMPSSNQGWPEEFGFQLGGNGPSYILSVEEGSSAHLAGLQAGDQVLEIEGHNVSTLGPQAVIAIAQTQKNIPPSIGVVSRIQQVLHHLLHPSQQ